MAKKEIERLCIDEKNTRLFQVRTKQAKEILIQKANDYITGMLTKIQEIVMENINRIGQTYQDMTEQI